MEVLGQSTIPEGQWGCREIPRLRSTGFVRNTLGAQLTSEWRYVILVVAVQIAVRMIAGHGWAWALGIPF